jgi:hypothetical protein
MASTTATVSVRVGFDKKWPKMSPNPFFTKLMDKFTVLREREKKKEIERDHTGDLAQTNWA